MSLEKYKQIIDEDFTKDVDFIDKTIKNLRLDKSSKVLDIGTGLGAMSILLAINGFHVLTGQPKHEPEWEQHEARRFEHEKEHEHSHGFNIDWRNNARAVGVEDRIRFQHLDVERLNFPDESFDAIFMYDTLQHIKNREVALSECIRVLKVDGLVCVIEWNERSIKEDEEKHGFKIDYIDPREILKRGDTSIELITGDFVNIFVVRKREQRLQQMQQ